MEERDTGRAGHEQQPRESWTCYDAPGTYPIPQIRSRSRQPRSKSSRKSTICNDANVQESSSWLQD